LTSIPCLSSTVCKTKRKMGHHNDEKWRQQQRQRVPHATVGGTCNQTHNIQQCLTADEIVFNVILARTLSTFLPPSILMSGPGQHGFLQPVLGASGIAPRIPGFVESELPTHTGYLIFFTQKIYSICINNLF